MIKNVKFWNNQYRIVNSSWQSWYFSSLRLREASILLWKKIQKGVNKMRKDSTLTEKDYKELDLFPVFMMLSGLSIELILKSLLVKNRKDRNIGHNILSFFDQEKISLTKQEKKLEKRLIKYVVWEGKYPTPLKFDDYPRDLTLLDNDLINKIYFKVKHKINTI